VSGGVPGATTTWGCGDYPAMAVELEVVARRVVESAGVGRGDRVLDVATGTGNAALAAAERGAAAVGVDTEPALLSVAADRSAAEGAAVGWVVGDVAALPLATGAVDVALSVLGIMYAADHARAAGELARVTRPGGRVALASWEPGGVLPAFGQVVGAHLPPPPPSSGPPTRWGEPDGLASLLGPAGLVLDEVRGEVIHLSFPDAEAGADFLVRTAGHVVAHRHALEASGRWDALHTEVGDLLSARGSLQDGRLVVPLRYLLAVTRR
jgi:SAM-dependent methyltransferase